MPQDLINITFEVPESLERKLRNPISKEQIEDLFLRIDRWMFHATGELANMIRAQKPKDGYTWPALSEKYARWKERMKQSRKVLKGEPAPNVVKYTDIWRRTGKMFEITQHSGTWGKKKVTIYPENFRRAGGVVMVISIEDIEYIYWRYVHGSKKKPRPLFFWTEAAKKKIKEIALDWIQGVIQATFPPEAVVVK